jgi:hypothetical protein
MSVGADLEFAVDSEGRRRRRGEVYAKKGAKVVDFGDAALAKWQVLAKPVWQDYAAKNGSAKLRRRRRSCSEPRGPYGWH